jgi:predicted nucleic acid-binding protein
VIVVSDASPLISLAVVGHLDLLRLLYSEVLIPEAVRCEVVGVDEDAPGVAELTSAPWIRVRAVNDRSLVEALTLKLDAGEAEAIVLSVENEAGLLLMDERRGRMAATRLGCRVVGVMGVLLEAKAQGHLSAVRPVLEALTAQAGFHVSTALIERVLEAAEE